jgi:hypothetical protein
LVGDKFASEKLVNEMFVSDKLVSDKLASDKAAGDKLVSDKLVLVGEKLFRVKRVALFAFMFWGFVARCRHQLSGGVAKVYSR